MLLHCKRVLPAWAHAVGSIEHATLHNFSRALHCCDPLYRQQLHSGICACVQPDSSSIGALWIDTLIAAVAADANVAEHFSTKALQHLLNTLYSITGAAAPLAPGHTCQGSVSSTFTPTLTRTLQRVMARLAFTLALARIDREDSASGEHRDVLMDSCDSENHCARQAGDKRAACCAELVVQWAC